MQGKVERLWCQIFELGVNEIPTNLEWLPTSTEQVNHDKPLTLNAIDAFVIAWQRSMIRINRPMMSNWIVTIM